eukprot:XP_011676286.1 PREDICTED: plexin-B1-like [Strongylocentrotus purpuratus]
MAWKGIEALLLFPILTSCQILSIQSAPLSSYLVSSFTPPDSDSTLPFNHIAINTITGDIYIGARERLYQLDSDLNLKHTVNTGKCTDLDAGNVNDNKLLIVVTTPQKNTLITCGGCDGYCETRSLTNISHDVIRYDSVNDQLVVRTDDLPTVGAVVLGADFVRDGGGIANGSFYLFTGASGIGFPFIAKHNLLDLILGQSIYGFDVLTASLFQHLIAYKDYMYYFISRGNSVYLGRLCRNSLDTYFASYTEIELQCGSHDMIQSAHIGPAGSQLADSLNIDSTDALLYAVFLKEGSSALCVYKMSDIHQSFEDAILGCIQGTSTGTTNSCLRDSICRESPVLFTVPDSVQCTAYFKDGEDWIILHKYASGTVPLSASPIVTIPDVIPTSIVTTTERQHTVAFIGDTQGELHKLIVVNGSFGYVYEDVFLGGGSVLQEMFLDELKEQLTLATSSDQGSKVLTLEIVNCGQYQSCKECIGEDGGYDGDPYCGWCTLEARCTRYEACPFPDESTRWLSYNALQCVSISDVQPDHRLPYQETEQDITITVQQLPVLYDSHQYQCAFDSYQVNADITTANAVMCLSPPASELPTIPEEVAHVTMTLSIVSTETGVSFVSTDFISFDCTHLKSCSPCVTSPWPCDWCVYDNMCTRDNSSCQPGETVVIGEHNAVGFGNKGQSYCPQLIGTAESYFIPVDIPSGYVLLAKNLPTDQTKIQSFDCILRIDGVGIRVPTSFFNESYIRCSAEEYMYNENIIEKNVSVSVQWNGQYNIDDPTDTCVTLYKCSVNSESCSRCLSKEATPSILNCGWCGDECNVIQSDVCQNNQFLSQNDTQLCSAPVITDFYPSSGPINAQTRLQMTGTDLGVEFDDVLKIVMGDLVCILSDMGSFYQPGQSVSCMTGISTELISGRIGITVRSGERTKTGESTAEFFYRDPMISGFSPTEGQVAGGTEITITGMYLNTGRNIEASFGEAQCNNLIVEDTTATCITSSLQMNEQVSVFLTMTFDGVEKTFEDFTFTYYPNPIIDGIDRTVSIMSGGLDIKLTGQRFDFIQEPRIIVSSLTTDASNSKLCNGTETLLICPTPSFPDDGISTRRTRATNGVMTANLTFDFDGYIVDGGLIEYYPDPMYESFIGPNRIYESGDSRLEIAGINLNLASTEDDILVLLGPNGVCDVDDLEIDILRCQLPEKRPLAGYANGSLGQGPSKNLPAVTVLHGNLRFSPGFVSASATEGNPLIAIVIPGVIVVPISIIIPMIFLVWWFRKKQLEVKRAKEEVKMIRMNILKRVREVSNTSLDLSEADDRVQKQGVPFVGHVQYVTMMLFAGLGIHPETTEPEYMEDFMEHSLISFYRMLKEKAGMIEFIRQLENKKTGLGRERELIASLLAITFVSEGKSIHFTNVLTSLVEDEIVTASKSRRRMDTLFTNTESIAEKLINNWFALFMFEYLKVYGVYPLYMLYQAVKAQAEKGPIDVVTGDAYYTLEFSKLLDQEIEFYSLGIDVVDEDGHVYLHMTVLDVDTVKQAKQKILDSLWKKSYCLLPRDIDAVDLGESNE